MGYFKEETLTKIKQKNWEHRSDMGPNSFNYDASVSQIRRALGRGFLTKAEWVKEGLLEFLDKIKILKKPTYSTGEILLVQDIIYFLDYIPLNNVEFLDSKIGDEYVNIKVSLLYKLEHKKDRDSYSSTLVKKLEKYPEWFLMDNYELVPRLQDIVVRDSNETLGRYLYNNISTMNSEKISLAMCFNWHCDKSHVMVLKHSPAFFNTYLESIPSIGRFNDYIEGKISLEGKEYMMYYINWLKKFNPSYEKK